MNWLVFALMTVLSWGVYGVLLHKGRGYMPMGPEAPNAGLKAFLFVCAAYALIGFATLALLKWRGSVSFTGSGIQWACCRCRKPARLRWCCAQRGGPNLQGGRRRVAVPSSSRGASSQARSWP
jgi:hypothetical protein